MRTRQTIFRNLVAAALCCATVGLAPGAVAQAMPDEAARSARNALEAKNLQLVLAFSEAVFDRHDMSVAERYVADNYVQHNPHVADGKAGFMAFFKAMAAQHPNGRSTIVRYAVNGDLVWTHVHVLDPGKDEVVLVNIFRVADGMIVEHWDVVQPVPGKSANPNTMY